MANPVHKNRNNEKVHNVQPCHFIKLLKQTNTPETDPAPVLSKAGPTNQGSAKQERSKPRKKESMLSHLPSTKLTYSPHQILQHASVGSIKEPSWQHINQRDSERAVLNANSKGISYSIQVLFCIAGEIANLFSVPRETKWDILGTHFRWTYATF